MNRLKLWMVRFWEWANHDQRRLERLVEDRDREIRARDELLAKLRKELKETTASAEHFRKEYQQSQREIHHLHSGLVDAHAREQKILDLYADANRRLSDWLARQISHVPIFGDLPPNPSQEETDQAMQSMFPKAKVHGRDAVNKANQSWMTQQIQFMDNLTDLAGYPAKENENGTNAAAASTNG